MRKICWATNFALAAAIKAYQKISDDSVKPAFTTTLGSMFASFRPDRALSIITAEPPRELFKDQPIEAAVILLPIFEFLRGNPMFSKIMLENISRENVASARAPPPFIILTLSSYLLTHASSTASARSLSYASLSLHILLAFVENDDTISGFCQPTEIIIPICRQVRAYVLLLDIVTDYYKEITSFTFTRVQEGTDMCCIGLLRALVTPQPSQTD